MTPKRLVRAVSFFVAGSVAALAAAMATGACRQSDNCGVEDDPPVAFFADTPRPRLCPSGHLSIVASEPELDGSITGTPSDAGSTSGNETREAKFAVIGLRDTSQPHEAAHVDISLEGDVLVALDRDETGCEVVADTRLECVLDSNGRARFKARTRPGARGTQVIVAASGKLTDRFPFRVGNADQVGSLRLLTGDVQRRTTRAASGVTCSSNPAATTCANITVRSFVLVNDSPAPQQIVSNVGLLPSGPTLAAWLSNESTCPAPKSDRLAVAFPPHGRLSNTAYVCTDGAETTALIQLLDAPSNVSDAGATDGAPSAFPVRVPLSGVPSTVTVSGGAQGPLQLLIRDCLGAPLGGVSATLAGAQTGTSNDAGLLVFDASAGDGGAVELRLESPAVLGAGETCSVAGGAL